ncbi:hypothetical protein K470DRAFT_260885 [Piedraia hortae CBS 480.64]|uniref:RING-type E3 ubiquitin transferase n=1 Tax=Piedraia hortae CBS 480.64 TaxID=1314780 RepID=A0A6A7BRH6_9PEZI|nr:hypothetical protein K470DRAFT_260885 [Piedraia hortae CBS 480.64]
MVNNNDNQPSGTGANGRSQVPNALNSSEMAGNESNRGRRAPRNRQRGKGKAAQTNRPPHSQTQTSSQAAVADNSNLAEDKPPPLPDAGGVLGKRLPKDAADSNTGDSEEDNGKDTAVCFICASDITHYSVGICNHRTCHICALRLRALYKTKACAHCRTETSIAIFTNDPDKKFEEYKPASMFRKDANLGIHYENQETYEDTIILLRYNCPDLSCDIACTGWPDLHRHVRSVHDKVMCDICTRHKKIFTHEHELFTRPELRQHHRLGDDKSGAVDKNGFGGHPQCGFCRCRFYGDEELYTHCRDRHERCHLCERSAGNRSPAYYVDYPALEQHFHKDHFPCMDPECLEKKFVVFDSELDLKAHQVEQHLGQTKGRSDRRVNLSNFDFREPLAEARTRPRWQTSIGANPSPDSAPPERMSREELAQWRGMEVHSAQDSHIRTIMGPQIPPPRTVRRRSPPPEAQPAAGAPNSASSAALTPQELARREQHAAVTQRAATLLGNDKVQMDEFRERVSSFRKGQINAQELIDAFFALFDCPSAELGKLIKELADIFELPQKRDDLIKAWADWRAINEDYPSLPAPSGQTPSSAADILSRGVGTNRVLKLKTSTAQSGRKINATPKSWATASNSQVKNSARVNGSISLAPGGWPSLTTSTAQASSSRAPALSSSVSRPISSRSNDPDAFPALPPAQQLPLRSVGSGWSKRVVRNAPINVWDAGRPTASAPATPSVETPQTKEKGRKGKKVVLQWR